MTVADIMSDDVRTIDAGASLAEARSIMRTEKIHHLVVVRRGRLAGVLSTHDLGGPNARGLRSRTVADAMKPAVVSVTSGTPLKRSANLMRGHGIGCLVVVDRGAVTGIVTFADLLHLAGKGLTRPPSKERAALHYRVPHVKQHRGGRAW